MESSHHEQERNRLLLIRPIRGNNRRRENPRSCFQKLHLSDKKNGSLFILWHPHVEGVCVILRAQEDVFPVFKLTQCISNFANIFKSNDIKFFSFLQQSITSRKQHWEDISYVSSNEAYKFLFFIFISWNGFFRSAVDNRANQDTVKYRTKNRCKYCESCTWILTIDSCGKLCT